MDVRSATSPADLERICRLRYDVFVEELDQFRDAADHERRRLSDAIDDVSHHLMAIVDDEVVGALRVTVGAETSIPASLQEEFQLQRFADIVPMERMIIFARFAVHRDHRATAVPVELLRALVAFGFEHRLELAFCDCEPHLLGLYGALGYRSYCSPFNDENLDMLVPLVLVNDRAYLEAIRSPMLDWGMKDIPPPENLEAILKRLPVVPPVKPLDLSSDEWVAEFERLTAIRPGQDHILAGLDRDDVDELVRRSHVLELEPGAGLIRRGQASRNAYVVLEGGVEAHAGDRVLRHCGAGEVVGDIAFLLGGRRIVDVRAGAEGARVLSISERSLNDLIESQSRTAALFLLNLARTGARRLAGAYEI